MSKSIKRIRPLNPILCEIASGRSLIGIPFAHIIAGSEIIATLHGLTVSTTVARAQHIVKSYSGVVLRVTRTSIFGWAPNPSTYLTWRD